MKRNASKNAAVVATTHTITLTDAQYTKLMANNSKNADLDARINHAVNIFASYAARVEARNVKNASATAEAETLRAENEALKAQLSRKRK